MIVLFKGTDKSKNYSPQALALCAGISATKYYKKTLVIQLTTKYPVEKYLIGKKMTEQNIDDNSYLFEDTGLDSLIRRVGVATFRQEHFSNAVMPVVNSENLFDVLEISKKSEEDLVNEISKNPTIAGSIIKSASKIYDNIFVLVNGKNAELIEGILPYIDKTVTCVAQSIKECISAPCTEDNTYLVTSYDYKSSYGIKQMKKTYNTSSLYIMPYNVDFKDAYTSNNMLQYILHNITPEETDYSFHLIDEMNKLTSYLLGENEEEDFDLKFSQRTLERIKEGNPVMLTGENINIVTEKTGFRKTSTRVKVSGLSELSECDESEFKKPVKKRVKKIKPTKEVGELKFTDLEDIEDLEDVKYDEGE